MRLSQLGPRLPPPTQSYLLGSRLVCQVPLRQSFMDHCSIAHGIFEYPIRSDHREMRGFALYSS